MPVEILDVEVVNIGSPAKEKSRYMDRMKTNFGKKRREFLDPVDDRQPIFEGLCFPLKISEPLDLQTCHLLKPFFQFQSPPRMDGRSAFWNGDSSSLSTRYISSASCEADSIVGLGQPLFTLSAASISLTQRNP